MANKGRVMYYLIWGGGGVLLPYIDSIGMCGANEYGYLTVLV